jgi:hypothetical protein
MIVGNGVFSYFENSKVEFCRRQANVVAHNLAREATLYNLLQTKKKGNHIG